MLRNGGLGNGKTKGYVFGVYRKSGNPLPWLDCASEKGGCAVAVGGAWSKDLDGEGRWGRLAWGCGWSGKGKASEVLGDVPVEAAVVGGCALGDVDAGYGGLFGGA